MNRNGNICLYHKLLVMIIFFGRKELRDPLSESICTFA